MPRVLIYTRVSLDSGGAGRSVAEQEAECRAWADREGWSVTHVISETGSASRYARSTRARSRWHEVEAAITRDGIDILLTWEASRATRQMSEYAALAEMAARHGVRWGYSGTLYDLSTRDGRFRTGLDALLAQDESGRTSERILRSTRARAVAGLPHGKIPYGYRREYDAATGALVRQVPDEETAPIVREVYRRFLSGDSVRSIALDLTARGIPTPRPAQRDPRDRNEWIHRSVVHILTFPAYAGLRQHQGQVIGEASWPALVERADWERVQVIRSDPTRYLGSRGQEPRYLLTGIARCGRCQARMISLKDHGRTTYTCGKHYHVARKMYAVDPVVEAKSLALYASLGDGGLAGVASDRVAQAMRDRDALEGRLDAFTNSAADGDISPARLAAIEARLMPQIRAARAAVNALILPDVLSGYDMATIGDVWAGLPLVERRRILRQTVSVTIMPSVKGERAPRPELIVVTPLW